ncbi:hypothetical protein Pelo_559 [Pelomyxa schiedti]|nr:hypothetical protein Pelo_559 [Pelomyxa schiedti]
MKERSRSSGRHVGDVIDDPMKPRWDAVMDEFTLCGECTDLVKKNWDPYRLALPFYSGCFVLLSVVLAAYIFCKFAAILCQGLNPHKPLLVADPEPKQVALSVTFQFRHHFPLAIHDA